MRDWEFFSLLLTFIAIFLNIIALKQIHKSNRLIEKDIADIMSRRERELGYNGSK